MNQTRLRRWAETLVVLGCCLMAMTAVAFADAPEATPTPTPAVTATAPPLSATPVATEVPVVAPTATATVTAALTATPTPAATVSATPTPSPTATATATATPAAPVADGFSFQGATRQAPEPTPTPTATPTFDGAQLTVCVFDEATGYSAVVVPANDPDPFIFNDPDNIIPAPPGGCETVDRADPGATQDDPLYLCHATGNPDRPFVLVGPLPAGDFGEHGDHRGDLIPAPSNTCPGLSEYAQPTPVPTATTDPAPDPSPRPDPTPTPEVGTDLPAVGDVLDEVVDTASLPSAVAPAAGTLTAEQLPFTGPEHLVVLFLLGTGLVLTGAGTRLLSRPWA